MSYTGRDELAPAYFPGGWSVLAGIERQAGVKVSVALYCQPLRYRRLARPTTDRATAACWRGIYVAQPGAGSMHPTQRIFRPASHG